MASLPGDLNSIDDIPADPLDQTTIDGVSTPGTSSDGTGAGIIQTAAPAISFGTTDVQPADQPGVYIGQNDSVLLTAWNSNAAVTSVTMQLRILNPDGTITIQALDIPTVTSDRQPNTSLFSTTEGWIIGAVAGPPGVAVSRGQCFVTLEIVRGAPPTQLSTTVLIADYLTTAFQPSWPWSLPKSAVDGRGASTPYAAVGGVFPFVPQIVQPAKTRWRLLSVTGGLQTNLTVGNRNVYILVIVPGGGTLGVGCNVAQPTNTQFSYAWGAAMQPGQTAPNFAQGSIPADLYTPAGTIIEFGVTGAINGDTLGTLAVTVEEWIDV